MSNQTPKGDYRSVYVTIWDDPDFRGFDNDTRAVFFNLRTSRFTNWPCIFVYYPEISSAQLNMPVEDVLKCVHNLCKSGWIMYDPPVLWIVTALRNDPYWYPGNAKQVAGIEKTLRSLPKTYLTNKFIEFYGLSIMMPVVPPPETGAENGVQMPLSMGPSMDPPIQGMDTYNNNRLNTTTRTKRLESASADALAALWNEICVNLPKCVKMTPKRKTHAIQRLKEHPMELWRGYFERIAASKFCGGENDRNWKATFDWIVASPDNVIKLVEGKYDDRIKNRYYKQIPPEPGEPGYDEWVRGVEESMRVQNERFGSAV